MYQGREGTLHWFTGVVENRDDPLKLGRVQVRIWGLHSDLKVPNEESGEGIPTEDLPWATPIRPINSAAMDGIGDSPTGIVEGTWVVGFSRDGEAYQDLLLMGVLGGIPHEGPVNAGFNDPNKKYPAHVGEPDVNRLARGEKTDETIVQKKKDSVKKGVATASGGSWDEPNTGYAAKYPYNHVRQSESGHVEEWDDTKGAERLHRYHKSGTFEEIHADGKRVLRVVGSDFEVIIKDRNMFVGGNINISVDGDSNIYTKGNSYIKVDGDGRTEVKGNLTQTVGGDCTTTVGGNLNANVSGNFSGSIGGKANVNVGGSLSGSIGGSATVTIGGSGTLKASGAMLIQGSAVIIKGSKTITV